MQAKRIHLTKQIRLLKILNMPHIDPWDRKVTDERQADTVKMYVIFCEDNNCEPFYFRSFGQDGIKINTIPNQRQGRLNLLNTIEECKELGLMVFEENAYRLNKGIKERIWCVYDRDMENLEWEEIDQQDHLDFDVAIQSAVQSGLRVAWSNDAFELWILLHFEDVPVHGRIHRDYIYERLTQIFRLVEPRTHELDAITGNVHFNYKTSFKRREYFLRHVLPFLKSKSRLDDAIRRASEIEANFNGAIAFHLRNPCTQVHHLVTDILKNDFPPA